MPMGWSAARSTSRIQRTRSAWLSCVPWLKLRRNRSAPASNRARTAAGVSLAGPSVVTILVRLSRRMVPRPRRCL